MKLNAAEKNTERTHEGSPAKRINPLQQLRRSVMACMLWEDGFYEDGKLIAERIVENAEKVSAEQVAALAIEARADMKLRHAPLLLLCALAKKGGRIVGGTIPQVVNRADELAELVAVYWRDGKRPLSKQMKLGLAAAFQKFDEYQLAKYNRDGAVKLRDVLFLCHAKPVDKKQEKLWKRLIDGDLKTPDTWEVSLSVGKEKKETFERLLSEGKLGYLALLRNLRNMADSGVNAALIKNAILARKGAEKVLPFRYIGAAKYCPSMEPCLDSALLSAIAELPVLDGKTIVLVDVSGSMNESLSSKSDMTRLDAAAALGAIVNAEDMRVFTFSNKVVECPPRKAMAGVQAIKDSQPRGGTYLGAALTAINNGVDYDRIIVITDEQTADAIPQPKGRNNYMINVASNQNGVGYHGKWTHLDGFSENVLRYIHEIEANQ